MYMCRNRIAYSDILQGHEELSLESTAQHARVRGNYEEGSLVDLLATDAI